MKLIGLDVGTKRIGVSKADSSVKIAVPYGMVAVDGSEFEKIEKLSKIYGTDFFVIGLPRNSKGEETAQSKYVRNFAKNLKVKIPSAKIKLQDESLTSVLAKENLKNKKGGISRKNGDVDTEAAVLILQDFLESASPRTEAFAAVKPTPAPKPVQRPIAPLKPTPVKSTPVKPLPPAPALKPVPTPPKNPTALEPYSDPSAPKTAKKRPLTGKPYKKGYKKWLLIRVFLILFILLGLAFISLKIWYSASLKPVSSLDCASSENAASEECKIVEFKVEDGDSVATIAEKLKSAGLIKSPLALKVFMKLNHSGESLKSGTYNLRKDYSVEEILKNLIEGTTNAIVFRLTILPGETLASIQKKLRSIGYSEEEIEAAFSKDYSHPILSDKPKDKSLEGYLFGDTYEFYQGESVENIIIRMLDQLAIVESKNNLRNKFAENGLSFYEGIILASIVQKEAGNLDSELKTVASVFYNRLNAGMTLGSDVTVSYALDQLSAEERAEYSDNAEKLTIDSCYNTRVNVGLPCGPISNPGALALIAVANPEETSYLYFLTGDDGMMYYSSTDSEHNQKIHDHCQELCNISL
ncbi:endolytic transglycosylase MltG [Candidatus Saccharibacteria bacterium]|nr:endolytic transglycosylase MltG [Candidatus Saccharibacteria bacterium]